MATYQDLEFVKNLKPKGDTNSTISLMRDKTNDELIVQKIIYGIDNVLYKTIFLREIRALHVLNKCENIVKMYFNKQGLRSSKTKQQVGMILMEYIKGHTIADIDVVELPVKERFRIIREILNAIEVAHAHGIIHRDLNPENVMLDSNRENSVKIIDFGICKIKDMASQKGTVYQFGTNSYTAPEIKYHSENATEQSDLYSIGALIYYLFTNEQPPIASDFVEKIDTTMGIDIELKPILKKLICENPEDRYDDIFQLKEDINDLILRKSQVNSQVLITCTYDKFSDLKKQKLISNIVKYDSALNKEIPINYVDVFGMVDDVKSGLFIFLGQNYLIKVLFHDKLNVFNLVEIKKVDPWNREKIKKNCIKLDVKMKFIRNENAYRYELNNTLEIKNTLLNFNEILLSKDNVSKTFVEKFGSWRQLLEFMLEEKEKNIIKIKYDSYKIEGNVFRLILEEGEFLDGIGLDVEQSFIIEKRNEKKIKPIIIGSYIDDKLEDERVCLYIKIQKYVNLDKKGYICLNYLREVGNIRRQLEALDTIDREESNCSFDLKSIITGIEKPGYELYEDKINYINQRLDPAQKQAVRKALFSSSISIIQGPPGTGKTNVIIEIIQQIIKENKMYPDLPTKKVLIVSQSHPAVDKMVSDLKDQFAELPNMIRVGNNEKINDEIKEICSLEAVQRNWIEKIKCECKKSINLFSEELGIDDTILEKYINIKSKEAVKGEKVTNIETEFKNQIEDKLNTAELKKIISIIKLQYKWIEQLENSNETELYQIKSADIIAGTCVGFLSNYFIRDIAFDYVIVDEAAKATFPELAISLNRANKIILVGDHKQLPPVLDDEIIKTHKEITKENLETGLFEIIYNDFPKENKQILSTQYRMHPLIGTMISKVFYDNEIQNGVPEEQRVNGLNSYKGISIEWVDTSSKSSDYRFEQKIGKNDNSTFRNDLECKIIKDKIVQIDEECSGDKKIAIITAYSGQKYALMNMLKQLNLKKIEVEINTVDAFQGSQKDIIIYSTVRSSINPKKIGFLKSKARLNVAFSRAKDLLIIVGDLEFLNHSEVRGNKFPEIIDYIKETRGCRITKCE